MESKIKSEFGGVYEEWVTKKVYDKDFVWVKGQKIQRWIFKEVGKELDKMKEERKFLQRRNLEGKIMLESWMLDFIFHFFGFFYFIFIFLLFIFLFRVRV